MLPIMLPIKHPKTNMDNDFLASHSNELSIFGKVEKVPDSIKVDDIIVYNLTFTVNYQFLSFTQSFFMKKVL